MFQRNGVILWHDSDLTRMPMIAAQAKENLKLVLHLSLSKYRNVSPLQIINQTKKTLCSVWYCVSVSQSVSNLY